jgi:hypothetical protein
MKIIYFINLPIYFIYQKKKKKIACIYLKYKKKNFYMRIHILYFIFISDDLFLNKLILIY